MSLVMRFGPLEENETTAGAKSSLGLVLLSIVAVAGLLHHWILYMNIYFI